MAEPNTQNWRQIKIGGRIDPAQLEITVDMMPLHKEEQPHHEVVVLGAGVAGIYQIKRLVDLGVDAMVLERDADLGGTWFWNRYPGARFDSESYTYGYSFSRDLLDEWHWSERFSGQPENLRYLNYVADKFALRRHMRFNCAVEAMTFDDDYNIWRLRLGTGEVVTCRFVVMGVGPLSTPTLPRLPGFDSFKGQSFHTFHWPSEPVELAGKKVGVIGTGATGIQVIAEIADKVDQLKVFQRRPNWSAPLNNGPISVEEMADIRSRYNEIFDACTRSPGGFEHSPDRRHFRTVSPEDRVALWDRLYDEPGFGILLQNFRDIFFDEDANAEFSDYIANRIRQRVHDPVVAEKLIPKDHGFGVQRLPLETNYYEVYNLDNVELIDISETPLASVTPTGIRTVADEYELDLIVYATGFDAVTGSYDRIDIRGVGGQSLREKWGEDPSTFLGILVHGFPNMAMLAGPQSGSGSANFPRSIETSVDWVTGLFQYVRENGHTRFEATSDAEQAWSSHVVELYQSMLMRKARGWFTGYNSNVEGHGPGTIRHFVYNGGQPKYIRRLVEVVEENYEGVAFSGDKHTDEGVAARPAS